MGAEGPSAVADPGDGEYGTDKQPIFVAVERHGQVRAVTFDSDTVPTIKGLSERFVRPDALGVPDRRQGLCRPLLRQPRQQRVGP